MKDLNNSLVIVRGGGDIATGVIQKLKRIGFKVVVLESDKPSSIRRGVCLSEAIYDGYTVVEDIKATDIESIKSILNDGSIPVIVDKNGEYIKKLKPVAVIDAILAKRNIGTNKNMAKITIGLGPGFCAGKDVDIVVETMRGHNLGRLIFSMSALENTGVPGAIAGVTKDRVIYSKLGGVFKSNSKIGDIVSKEQVLGFVDGQEVIATIDGVLRGIIRDGFYVKQGLKIIDIDPRINERENCNIISDKARAIGGAVLEGILLSLE